VTALLADGRLAKLAGCPSTETELAPLRSCSVQVAMRTMRIAGTFVSMNALEFSQLANNYATVANLGAAVAMVVMAVLTYSATFDHFKKTPPSVSNTLPSNEKN
jgi:hypothetical protein